MGAELVPEDRVRGCLDHGTNVLAARQLRLADVRLVEPQTDVARDNFIDPEVFEGLTGIEIGFACSENAETRLGTIPDQTIELVGARIGQRRIPFGVKRQNPCLASETEQYNCRCCAC